MSNSNSRFAPSTQTTNQRLSSNTVGLVALSDFRKRRAEVLEQQEKEARDEASASNTPGPSTGVNTPNRSASGTPDVSEGEGNAEEDGQPVRKKTAAKKKQGKKLLSFGDDEEDEEDAGPAIKPKGKLDGTKVADGGREAKKNKFKPNANVVAPKSYTKASLLKEATERDSLRREFLEIQERVKATEIAIPFNFYDGSNIPGGVARVKKGDFVWVFLDKGRKVGAELGVDGKGERKDVNMLKAWARVGVDDLIMVRNGVIIPHHFDFYHFIINKSMGPGGKRLFDFSAEVLERQPSNAESSGGQVSDPLVAKASKSASTLPDIKSLEGAGDDPSLTKVVDRRWYERNKHIYPASTWAEFDPEKDYSREIRRDQGGNAFFFSR